ncbi:GNAT family N-acetyltransferase [Shewanella youngdeokensis]|uniref:GNAT family N-acetyltransferase n=1 Tax=Shewanella youngdeokensis TaxID=2999068 RepID=A0ABZ0JYZ8_9GAMM|nr:GNAT family N-acetyltransferase [Shewanella sp. DAU334]
MKNVRAATLADLPAIQALAKETIRHNYRAFLGDDGVEWFINGGGLHKEVNEYFDDIVVLEIDNEIQGYCAAEEGFIHALMIRVERQQTGLGRYLLNHVEQMQCAEGYEHLRLETYQGNEPALKLFSKQGWFVAEDQHDASFGLKKVSLRKLLAPR